MVRCPRWFGGGGARGSRVREWEVCVSHEGEVVVLLRVMREERG